MRKKRDSDLQVTFFGPATRAHTVPAEVLAASLDSLQKLVHLLALCREKDNTHVGTYIPADIRDRYPIVCRVPESGSYTVPISLGPASQSHLSDFAPELLHNLSGLLQAVQNQDEPELERMFPAPRTRAAATRALYNMVPAPRSGARLRVNSRSNREIFAPDPSTRRFLKSFHASREHDEIENSLAGHLKEIDFQQQRIRLQHPPTGRQLTCPYPRELEASLVDSRRALVQVLGEVIIGPGRVPKRIRSADTIHPVDLSPIELSGFTTRGRRIRAKRPITFEPAMDDTYQYFVLRQAPFGIHLLSQTREDLKSNLLEEMDVLWRHYARADDAKLTPAARELKRQLRAAFQTA